MTSSHGTHENAHDPQSQHANRTPHTNLPTRPSKGIKAITAACC